MYVQYGVGRDKTAAVKRRLAMPHSLFRVTVGLGPSCACCTVGQQRGTLLGRRERDVTESLGPRDISQVTDKKKPWQERGAAISRQEPVRAWRIRLKKMVHPHGLGSCAFPIREEALS